MVFLPAVVGVLLYKKYKKTDAKYFIWFCIYVAIVEIIGSYNFLLDKLEPLYFIKSFFEGTIFENSKWWYLIFWTLGGALFYAYFFWRLVESKISKKVIKFSAIIYFSFFVLFFIIGFDEITTSAQIPINVAEAFLIVLSVLVYFLEVLKSDKVLSIFSSIYFYIGAVILLWHLIMTPLTFYELYFNTSDMDYAIMKAVIFLVCNSIMYLTFSFALIWCKPQNN